MTVLSIIASMVFLLIAAIPQPTFAGMIQGDVTASTEGLANFTGNLAYDQSAAELTVTLTNITPVGGGFITAFAFNNPNESITTVSSFGSTSGTFNTLLGVTMDGTVINNNVSASPFGDFDIGVATGGSWEGVGDPSGGIAVGDTAIFTFGFTGTDLNTLTQQSFEDAFSSDPGGGGAQFFAVRFRGITIGAGSDKVPGTPGGNGPPPIPEPGTLLLIGSGLVGLGAGAWRRKKH